MRITDLRIENYRSLDDFSMADLGDLVILTGENGSGKSNLVEALELFFRTLQPAPTITVPGYDDFVWFDRDTSVPIRFSISMLVDPREIRKKVPRRQGVIVPTALQPLDKVTQAELTIVREAHAAGNGNAEWRTIGVSLLGIPLMADGQPSDALVKAFGTAAAEEDERFTQATEYLNALHAELSKELQHRFRVISAARASKALLAFPEPTAAGPDRISFIPTDVESELRELSHKKDRETVRRKYLIGRLMNTVLPDDSQVVLAGGEVQFVERDIDFRTELTGGGHQAFLALVVALTRPGVIVGIEEPELHLHARFCRKLLRVLEDQSRSNQIFVSSHSPIFLDYADLGSIWHVAKLNRRTIATRISSIPDLRAAFYALGEKPSAVLGADKILWVEGKVDVLVLQILADRMGIDFAAKGISLIAFHGASKAGFHFEMWNQIHRDYQQLVFIILDGHAQEQEQEAIEAGIPKERIIRLSKHDILDYLPGRALARAIEEEFSIETVDGRRIIEPKKAKVRDILEQNDRLIEGWQERIARCAASELTDEDIPQELKVAIREAEQALS